MWILCSSLPLRWYCQVLQATFQLVLARFCSFCCVYMEKACLWKIQNPKMPRTTKSPHMWLTTMKVKKMPVHKKGQALNRNKTKKFFLPWSQAQLIPNMFMSYTEGPKMAWTINDGIYHRFLKRHFKCETILKCEFVMLSERRKCRKQLLGVVILTWTSMFPGVCQLKN